MPVSSRVCFEHRVFTKCSLLPNEVLHFSETSFSKLLVWSCCSPSLFKFPLSSDSKRQRVASTYSYKAVDLCPNITHGEYVSKLCLYLLSWLLKLCIPLCRVCLTVFFFFFSVYFLGYIYLREGLAELACSLIKQCRYIHYIFMVSFVLGERSWLSSFPVKLVILQEKSGVMLQP